MATTTSAVLEDIRDEVTCPICLELLTEPLSIDCGHSFCQACITGNSDKSGLNQEGKSNCPVCQTTFQPGNLRPNRHLATIVKRLREVVLGPGKQPEVILCALHGEKLQLFCKEDGKLICWLCERSQEHRGHHTFLMEEVAQEYQVGRGPGLTLTSRSHREPLGLQSAACFSSLVLKNQAEPERHRIQTEFKQLRNILDREEQRELKKLEVEERKGLSIIEKAEGDLIHQSQSLKDLISDLEHRCQGSTVELLQLIRCALTRSEFWTLRKPQTLPTKLKSLFRAPDLEKMLRVFRELTDVQSYWVDVTLNPQTANLNLVLSKNRRQDHRELTSVPIWPLNCYNNGILGSKCFSSGKHYWEVDVSKKNAWILGVYVRKRTLKFDVRRGKNQPNVCHRYKPQNGYWVIGLQGGSKYSIFEDPSNCDPTVLTPFVAAPLHRVGVFLDCEEGIVSFFNVTNHGSLIYTFFQCCFSHPAYPYFNPWNCPAPMTLCPLNS
ncbi:Tripartite motif-containing protein 6 [Lemmus lemmus]